jgi:uncharacterized protein DUF4132/HEAT repeat protein
MTRLQKSLSAIDPCYTQMPIQDMTNYIVHGDEAALARLAAARDDAYVGHRLVDALAAPPAWTDEDRRVIHALAAIRQLNRLDKWLGEIIGKEKPDEDYLRAVCQELEAAKVRRRIILDLSGCIWTLTHHKGPNSVGRFILGLSDAELKTAATASTGANFELIKLLARYAPERIEPLVPEWLKYANGDVAARVLLEECGDRFEKPIAEFFHSVRGIHDRFALARALHALNSQKYMELALETACGVFAYNDEARDWMFDTLGKKALPHITTLLRSNEQIGGADPSRMQCEVLSAAVEKLAKDAIPACVVALGSKRTTRTDTSSYWTPPELHLHAAICLIGIDDGTHDDLILRELDRVLSNEKSPSEHLTQAITAATKWKLSRVAEPLWKLTEHKSRPIRSAAARALGQLGDAALPRAGEMLTARKADQRSAAVTLLVSMNTPKALKLLEDRLDEEPDDDVRDAILVGLEAAWEASGRKITKKDIDARIERAKEKLKELPVKWLNEKKLPPLKFAKGGPLTKEQVRYLLYRQSRAKEIRPDIEAKPLYALIDRKSSRDFALEVLKGFLATNADAGDRWALTIAGLLGDDRCVPLLNQHIRTWADSARGKMAEYAVQALALLGTDSALLTLDALAIRYRTKYKNIGKAAVEAFAEAAERLGITPEELGDRVVPWLGFEPGKPRVIVCGDRKIEARIGLDFKLKYIDLEKHKPIASLPKTAPAEVLASFKDLAANLREIAKAQHLRLENLMVRQQRWPAARWRELFLRHPLLLPFAVRLVWGAYDEGNKLLGTFRALEDGSLTTAADEPFMLADSARAGIVHPLELPDEQRTTWLTHLADYEITPPFPQLERPVVRLAADKKNLKTLKDFTGTSLNGMTFKGRAERLGWNRGSVQDAGSIVSYCKSFPAAGADAFLGIDGMYMGMDMYTEIKLQDLHFVRSGSVKVGSYSYDEPGDEKDQRVLAFGDVPAIVYSEVLGDLQKISGQKAGGEDEE